VGQINYRVIQLPEPGHPKNAREKAEGAGPGHRRWSGGGRERSGFLLQQACLRAAGSEPAVQKACLEELNSSP